MTILCRYASTEIQPAEETSSRNRRGEEKVMYNVRSSTKATVKDNDAIHLKLTKAMRQIKRLRVERM